MTVQALSQALSLQVFHLAEPEREVTGGYCGDLLSWVMGRAPGDCAWLTIMSNDNVAAVASLADVACVILAEGVRPEEDLLNKARGHGVNVLGYKGGVYQLSVALADALRGSA